MTLPRFLLRLLGWLLTPLVAWAASFGGASLGAAFAGTSDDSTTGFWITFAFGTVSALVAAWAWLRLIRRHPELQHVLEVAPDGTPLAAIEPAPKDTPP